MQPAETRTKFASVFCRKIVETGQLTVCHRKVISTQSFYDSPSEYISCTKAGSCPEMSENPRLTKYKGRQFWHRKFTHARVRCFVTKARRVSRVDDHPSLCYAGQYPRRSAVVGDQTYDRSRASGVAISPARESYHHLSPEHG